MPDVRSGGHGNGAAPGTSREWSSRRTANLSPDGTMKWVPAELRTGPVTTVPLTTSVRVRR